MKVKRMEIVRLFVTPDDLTRLAKRVQDAYDERNVGHKTIVESIVNDSERIIVDIHFDQFRMDEKEDVKQ